MDKTQHGRDSEHSDGVSDMLSHDGDVNFRYQPHHHHHHRGRRGRIPGEKAPRKKKDPNAPKGPGNVFFLFCRLERDKVKDAFPQESLGDVTKLLGQKWKGLTREEKQKYYDMYKKEMDEYEVAMKSYNEATTNTNNNPTSSEPVDNEAEAVAAAAEDAAAAALAGAENYSTVSSPMQSSAMPSPELQSDPLLPPEDHDMDEEEEQQQPAGGLASVDSSLSPQQDQSSNHHTMTTASSSELQDPSTKQSSPMQQDAGSM